MTFDKRKWPLLALPLATAIGLAGIATAATNSHGDTLLDLAPEPFRCEIAATETGPMIALETRVFANQDIAGRYSLTVKSAGTAGSTNIRQGGAFTAGPGEMVALGKVMIGNNVAGYIATLEITTPDHVFDCREQVGGVA
jgi:CsgH protein